MSYPEVPLSTELEKQGSNISDVLSIQSWIPLELKSVGRAKGLSPAANTKRAVLGLVNHALENPRHLLYFSVSSNNRASTSIFYWGIQQIFPYSYHAKNGEEV